MTRRCPTIWLCVVAFAFAWWSAGFAIAQDDPGIHVRTINGLKQRRLFDMAQTWAQSLIAENKLSGRDQVDVVVAMIDAMAQKACQSSDPSDWEAARKVAADQLAASQSPRKILIDVQAALVNQLQVERQVREIEMELAKPETREQALAGISGLVTRFRGLQTEIKSLLNRRPSPREEAEWFSPNELLTLRYNIEYQQAHALQLRAALYGQQEELSRNDVLTLVEDQLKSVLQSTGPNQPLWWTVQADRIAIARTLNDFRRATQIHQNLPKTGGDPQSRNKVKAEWIRTLSRRRRLDEAIAVAGKESFASASPKLDLARVELFVAMAGNSNDRTWQQRALDLTKSIEQNHGSYWGRLANLAVLDEASITPETGSNLDLLIRVADEAQRKKQWDEAIKALDAAYAQASQAGQTEIAWKLGFRAASIEQTQGRYEKARERFEQLANAHRDLPDAHSGYLMASWNLTRTMGKDQAKLKQYVQMLARLIETWPRSSSADQARLWLANVRKSERNWPAAIGLLLDVNAASPLFENAVVELGFVSGQYMRQDDISKESKSNVSSALVVRLHPLIAVEAESMPENWPRTRAQIIALLMEMKMLYGAQLPADLTPALRNVLNDAASSPDARRVASALQYVLGGGKLKLAATPTAQARQLQIIYQGLLPRQGAGDVVAKAGRFAQAAKQFATEISQLPDAEKRQWANATIDALVWSGQNESAVQLASDLAEQYPRDAAAQIRLAELLTAQAANSSDNLAKALTQWRKVARSSRKNTGSWFLAKYFVAKLQADQGETDDALKLLNFIRAVPPGWDNAPNAQDFDALFKSLGGK